MEVLRAYISIIYNYMDSMTSLNDDDDENFGSLIDRVTLVPATNVFGYQPGCILAQLLDYLVD